MSIPEDVDPSMTFVAVLSVKQPDANMVLVIDRLEDRSDVHEIIACTYSEDLVGLLFCGQNIFCGHHNIHNVAVRFYLSSQSCADLARKLIELLQKRENSIKGAT